MPPYLENTRAKSASVAAPGAGGVVAAIVAPPAGLYRVRIVIAITGTAEAQPQNLRLRENGATVVDTIPTLTGLVIEACFPMVEVNDGGGNLDVVAIAAATAGSVYSAILTAERLA